jgi:hypothetical protein
VERLVATMRGIAHTVVAVLVGFQGAVTAGLIICFLAWVILSDARTRRLYALITAARRRGHST